MLAYEKDYFDFLDLGDAISSNLHTAVRNPSSLDMFQEWCCLQTRWVAERLKLFDDYGHCGIDDEESSDCEKELQERFLTAKEEINELKCQGMHRRKENSCVCRLLLGL